MVPFSSEPYYLYLPCFLESMRRTRQSQKNLTPQVFSNNLNNTNETIPTSYTGSFSYLCHYSLLSISDAKGKKSRVLSFTTRIWSQLSGCPGFNFPCSGKDEPGLGAAVAKFVGHWHGRNSSSAFFLKNKRM